MNIFIEKQNKNKKLKHSGTVESLLEKLKINPETVMVTRDNELLTIKDTIKDSDSINILSIISGG